MKSYETKRLHIYHNNYNNINNFNFSTMKTLILLLFTSLSFSQVHIKDNQSFHIAVGNNGIEIETSRNIYIRTGLSKNKAVGCIGVNLSDSYDDQWVNHFGIRLGKLYSTPTAVFGLEYGVDKKLTEKLFIGCRVYNDWIANNIKTEKKLGFGIRLGFYL